MIRDFILGGRTNGNLHRNKERTGKVNSDVQFYG